MGFLVRFGGTFQPKCTEVAGQRLDAAAGPAL